MSFEYIRCYMRFLPLSIDAVITTHSGLLLVEPFIVHVGTPFPRPILCFELNTLALASRPNQLKVLDD